MNPTTLARFLALGIASLTTACMPHHSEHHQHYAPGLGEIMSQSALRHAKLWFAGQAQNWGLAAYELDELKEGFEDAGKYHPTHKDIAIPIPDLIASTMEQPLAQLEQTISNKDQLAFTKSYDRLTAACNSCHQSTNFGFNIVTRPTFNPFANQRFKAEEKH